MHQGEESGNSERILWNGRYDVERGMYRTLEVVKGIDTKTIVPSSLEYTISKHDLSYKTDNKDEIYDPLLGPIYV